MRTFIDRPPCGRRALALMAALLLVPCLLAVMARPAAAATCSAVVGGSVGIESRISFSWDPECSDAHGQIWGVIRDTTCDMRAARGQYKVFDRRPNGTYVQIDAPAWPLIAPNGCGTEATFTKRTNSPGSLGWKLVVEARACSSALVKPCSATQTWTWTG